MWKSFTALAASAVLLAGCASNEPTPQAAAPATANTAPLTSGKAGLYVYRDSFARALNNNITLNGQCLGQSKNGGYFFVELPAGKHKVETFALIRPQGVELDMQAGKNYYVRHYLQLHLVAPYSSLEVVTEEEARPVVAKLQPLESGHCK